MFYLLDPRVWIAALVLVCLGASHTIAYQKGKSAIRAEWNKDIAARTAQALEIERKNRAKEQELIEARQQAEAKYAQYKRKADDAARSAQSELERLRNLLAARGAAGGATGTNTTPAGGNHGRAGLEAELLGDCARALVEVAADADRLGAQVIGLQGYVKQVCQGPP